MQNFYCLNNISSKGTDLLGAGYSLCDELNTADALLVRSASLHETDFPSGLLCIARAGAGVNNIPLDRCAEKGIVVFNTPGANANAVKELVVCALLLGSRGIVQGCNWVSEHSESPSIAKDIEKAKKSFAGNEISGKTLGVVGLGAIGVKVANVAIDLGMEVLGYDVALSTENAERLRNEVRVVNDIDELYKASDYISLHLPALPSTIKMIDSAVLGKCRRNPVLLNFSRDTLIDAEALRQALDEGTIKSYLTDFATPEIVSMKNAIVIPHLGASTAEAEENCAVMAVEQCMSYLEKGSIVNSVNFPALEAGDVPEGIRRLGILHRANCDAADIASKLFESADVIVMSIKSATRKDWGYTVIDADAGNPGQPADALEKLEAADGVVRVRVIQ